MERCKIFILSACVICVTNSSCLDWYHCTLLRLVVCRGISHDEAAQQENQECKVGVIDEQHQTRPSYGPQEVMKDLCLWSVTTRSDRNVPASDHYWIWDSNVVLDTFYNS